MPQSLGLQMEETLQKRSVNVVVGEDFCRITNAYLTTFRCEQKIKTTQILRRGKQKNRCDTVPR